VNDLLNNMMADKGIAIDEAGIAKLAAKAQEQVQLERDIAKMSEQLAALGARHRAVSEVEIPEAMTALGVSEFKLTDGSKITIKPFYSGSLAQTNPRREEAFSWLKEHGHDDIIKNEVVVAFGRGEDNEAAELVRVLRDEMKLSPQQDKSVHGSTLKAFIKEQVEAGKALPLDLFKAYIGRKSIIDVPKKEI
jgi:hypothetical protein